MSCSHFQRNNLEQIKDFQGSISDSLGDEILSHLVLLLNLQSGGGSRGELGTSGEQLLLRIIREHAHTHTHSCYISFPSEVTGSGVHHLIRST